MICKRCDGCGQVADSDDGEPWTSWTSLPPISQDAMKLGLVKPIECPDCGGSGSQKPGITFTKKDITGELPCPKCEFVSVIWRNREDLVCRNCDWKSEKVQFLESEKGWVETQTNSLIKTFEEKTEGHADFRTEKWISLQKDWTIRYETMFVAYINPIKSSSVPMWSCEVHDLIPHNQAEKVWGSGGATARVHLRSNHVTTSVDLAKRWCEMVLVHWFDNVRGLLEIVKLVHEAVKPNFETHPKNRGWNPEIDFLPIQDPTEEEMDSIRKQSRSLIGYPKATSEEE